MSVSSSFLFQYKEVQSLLFLPHIFFIEQYVYLDQMSKTTYIPRLWFNTFKSLFYDLKLGLNIF